MTPIEHIAANLANRRSDLLTRLAAVERRLGETAAAAQSAARAAARLAGSRPTLVSALASPSSLSSGDLAANEMLLRLADNTRDELRQVGRAIRRIDAGLFGRCEHCNAVIGQSRLLALPEATACSDCARLALAA